MTCQENCNCSICDLSLSVPWRAPNKVLRFNAAWDCLEAVPLSSLLTWIDTKVSVDSTDVWCPQYLYDKLTSSDNTILISKQTIGSCKKVDLKVNKNSLAFSFLDLTDTPDSYPDCATECWYPVNAYVRVNQTWDGLYFDCQCCDEWFASITLSNNVIIDQATNEEKFYVFCGTPTGMPILPNAELTLFGIWNIDHNRWLSITDGCIDFDECSAGIWRVSFDWHQEVNKWVHGTRVWLLLIRWWVAYYFTETRYSWLSDVPYSPNPHPDFWPFGNNTLTTAWWGNGMTFSLWRIEERKPVWKTRHISILPWDTLISYAKLSTVLTGDADAASIDGQLVVLWWSPWTWVAADSWFNISLEKLWK